MSATTESLPERIKSRRKALRLTQVEAARQAGVTQSYWARIESGQYTPSLAVLLRISAALRVSPGKLL